MAISVPADEATPGAVRSALSETAASLRAVFSHPALRRIELALSGSMIGDWAYATAVTVWAYGVGGAKAVGLWGAIRLILMAVSAPLAASLADKWPRRAIMISADILRCAFVSVAAACVALDTPAAPIFILATLSAMLGSVFRPAQAALLPSLADRPEQLTAANGVSSTVESLSFFVGPALGASLIAATDVQTVFVINAVTFLWSAALVAGIKSQQPAVKTSDEAEHAQGVLAEMSAGFREIFKNRDLRLVAFLMSIQTVVAGASSVFSVLLAIDVLEVGARGVGYVDAALGVGAVFGGFFAISRASRTRLISDLTAGVILWSLPLLLVAAWPSKVTLFAAMALLGFGNPLVDINFYTAIQRLAPDRVLGRVFGAAEGSLVGSMAIGAGVMPWLVNGTSLRAAIVIIALVVGIPAIALIPVARGVDHRLRAPAGLALLQPLPIFAPLGPARVEALARHLQRIEVPADSVVITEGEHGDLFYVIESGRVAVTHGDQFVRHEGPGEYFGEIALLRDVPRTATVTATEDTVLLTLARTPFLEAVTGNDESSSALEDVITYRLRF